MEEVIEKSKEFIKTVMYNGKVNEDYVSTRVRLYDYLKTKFSMPLPTDPQSIIQEKNSYIYRASPG